MVVQLSGVHVVRPQEGVMELSGDGGTCKARTSPTSAALVPMLTSSTHAVALTPGATRSIQA